MALRIRKMDGRHTGKGFFTHYLDVYTSPVGMRAIGSSNRPFAGEHYNRKYGQFVECRNWCWENWGPSVERDLYIDNGLKGLNLPICQNWAWYSDYGNYRIYFASEGDAGMFALHWNLQ